MNYNYRIYLSLGILGLSIILLQGYFFFGIILLLFVNWLYETNQSHQQSYDEYIATKHSSSTALQEFMYMKYQYLRSAEWQAKRQAKLAEQPSCQICGTRHALQVHHLRDYMLIPHEPLSSLAVLCSDCHQFQHDTLGYPQTYNDYVNWNVELVRPS